MAAEGRRDWTLKIAGWGNYERVRRVAAQHGIADCVELLGPLDHAALARELQWAQLAILPSHTESFGLAIAEAQASGLSVVAYAVGAVPEVVENNITGWLAPVGRVELIAQAVQAAMADPHRTFRAGLAGRERVTRLFSWPRTAAAMLEGIEQAMEARSRA